MRSGTPEPWVVPLVRSILLAVSGSGPGPAPIPRRPGCASGSGSLLLVVVVVPVRGSAKVRPFLLWGSIPAFIGAEMDLLRRFVLTFKLLSSGVVQVLFEYRGGPFRRFVKVDVSVDNQHLRLVTRPWVWMDPGRNRVQKGWDVECPQPSFSTVVWMGILDLIGYGGHSHGEGVVVHTQATLSEADRVRSLLQLAIQEHDANVLQLGFVSV